jgi:hypothetical protein
MGSTLQNRPASLESEADLSFEALAARQGVKPVAAFEDLLGSPAAEDESPEEFAIMLRAWRNDGACSSEPG